MSTVLVQLYAHFLLVFQLTESGSKRLQLCVLKNSRSLLECTCWRRIFFFLGSLTHEQSHFFLNFFSSYLNLEAIWRDTLADDPAIQRGLQQGGLTPTEVDPNLYHDFQATLNRLVGKVDQLLDNLHNKSS